MYFYIPELENGRIIMSPAKINSFLKYGNGIFAIFQTETFTRKD